MEEMELKNTKTMGDMYIYMYGCMHIYIYIYLCRGETIDQRLSYQYDRKGHPKSKAPRTQPQESTRLTLLCAGRRRKM